MFYLKFKHSISISLDYSHNGHVYIVKKSEHGDVT